MTKSLVVIILVIAIVLGLAGCKLDQPAGRHEAPTGGRHRVNPAPQPDPAPTRSGIGNVQITVWVEQHEERSTVLVNVGAGNQTLIGRAPGRHWDFTVRPGQVVYVSVNHFHLGESGRLFVQVVQNNNGRILCGDENTNDRAAGVQCTGTVVI
jgi:regulator of protease activity HflC (stomatin/prohibitin superfamily)